MFGESLTAEYDDVNLVQKGTRPTERKIVHIGGNSRFFRAHWADYISDMLEEDPRWGITAVALGHSPDSRDKTNTFSHDNNQYALVAQGAGLPKYKLIRSVVKNIFAPDAYDTVYDEMAAPEVEIFSMTITDPGYCRDRTAKETRLDRENTDIAHDLDSLRLKQEGSLSMVKPKSAIGLVVAALQERKQRGAGGVTVLSLDNLEGNGDITSALVKEMAQEIDLTLASWIEHHAAFPNTAVDRITPKSTPAFNEAAASAFNGYSVIGTEVPRELAIGTQWAHTPPPLNKAGVILTNEPHAFFTRKFRVLNTGHTIIATLAQRIGTHRGNPVHTIDQAIQIPEVNSFFAGLLKKEIIPALPHAAMHGIGGYVHEVIDRFGNELLGDQVARVGGEGQRKIPKYIVSSIQHAQSHGLPYTGLTLVLASWTLSAANSMDQDGNTINLNDPNLHLVKQAAEAMRDAVITARNPAQAAANVVTVTESYGFWNALAGDPEFAQTMAYYIDFLNNKDLRIALAEYSGRAVPQAGMHVRVPT